jgi:TatD DNase family protein
MARDKNQKDILENFKRSGGIHLISIWTDLITSQKSIDLANQYDFIYATVWIHPTDVLQSKKSLEEDLSHLEDFIKTNRDKIVWIWETGLDYHWVSKDPEILIQEKEKQENYFIAHIELAKKYNLPIIIHNRDSWEDILKILEKTQCKNFIIHCFSEDLDFANRCFNISSDAKMSFSGIVTFKNAKLIAETAANIPLRNILIETDSPFLTPVPYRWKQENEPAFTHYVLEKIIELRSETSEEITQQILSNSIDIYNLPK